MSAHLIQTCRLSKVYDSGAAPVHALREVDLDVEQGELLVLMGSSGSGKSTLLYVISGLEQASEGEIHFDGRRIDRMDETELSMLRREGLGFVFQAINLIPHLTLLENVVLPGYLVNANRDEVDHRATSMMERLGIGALLHRLPAQVSGGEQQRAAIARAMINAPRALLADEPTGALNSASGHAVLEGFREINALGQTIVMATHEVKSACIGDRILFMRDGQIRGEYRLKALQCRSSTARQPSSRGSRRRAGSVMRSIRLIAFANLRRRKGQSVLVGAILTLSALMLYTGIGVFREIDAPAHRMLETQRASQLTLFFDARIHEPESVRSWWLAQPGVVAVSEPMATVESRESALFQRAATESLSTRHRATRQPWQSGLHPHCRRTGCVQPWSW